MSLHKFEKSENRAEGEEKNPGQTQTSVEHKARYGAWSHNPETTIWTFVPVFKDFLKILKSLYYFQINNWTC